MSAFITLFLSILPLGALIFLGYIAGRHYGVERQSLAKLAIYICMPVVVFGFIMQIEFKAAYIALPIFYYIFSSIMGFSFLAIGKRVYGDKRANLLAIMASQVNSGYMGLPIVLIVFDLEYVAVYMLMIMGGIFFESTIYYYIAARGAFNPKDSLRKLLSFPVFYALALAIVFRFLNVEMPDMFWTYWDYFKGGYVLLGMMIIGISLTALKHFTFSLRFNALVFFAQYVGWAALALIFIMLDYFVFSFFEKEIYMMLILIAALPPAANTAAFASEFNLDPEKAATTILVTTAFSLLLIPLVLTILTF